MSSFEDIITVLREEREYQDQTSEKWKHKGTPPVSSELVLAKFYLDRAFELQATASGDIPTLAQLRRVAAILIRCMENHGTVARTPLDSPVGESGEQREE